MTTKVISVGPEMLLRKAMDILLENGFNGLPVLDKDGFLIGILTEFDVIVAGLTIYVPAFRRLSDNPDFYKDKGFMKEDLGRILDMKVKEVMNTEPLVFKEDASVEDAIKAFSDHHKVNPIPIVDDNRKVLGIISRYDVIKFVRSTISSLTKSLSY